MVLRWVLASGAVWLAVYVNYRGGGENESVRCGDTVRQKRFTR